jgi:hypothetical protein
MKDALQLLIDGGLKDDKVRDICDDIVECDSDERWAAMLAYDLDNGNRICPDDISEISYYDNGFSSGGAEYLVLTDDEADEVCAERIKDSLWAFNAEFLGCMTQLPDEVFTALADKCEDSNDAIERIIDGSCGLDDFVDNAVQSDGRGHFVASYDGEECEVCVGGETFLVYRIN